MIERKIWAFFYGSYLNLRLLEAANFIPDQFEVARLNSFDITIRPHANLIPSSQHCVYGILASGTHLMVNDVHATHARSINGEVYFPEAVLVETLDGKWKPALCYIAPQMQPRPADKEYIDHIITTARVFEFPEWYIERLEKFYAL